ncbi:MAG TPA: hypothetical protein VEY14_05030, partial [Nocardioidaceae bacterium]|nr:hypothetical protein [Nocardioidaceae bacterium]
RQSLIDVLGVDWTVETVVEPPHGQSEPSPRSSAAPSVTEPPEPPEPQPSAAPRPAAATPSPPDDTAPQRSPAPDAAVAWPDPVRLGGPVVDANAVDADPALAPREAQAAPASSSPPRRSSEARAAIRPTRVAGAPAQPTAESPDTAARPDDPDLDDDGLHGADLLASRLGAQVIEEIPHEP